MKSILLPMLSLSLCLGLLGACAKNYAPQRSDLADAYKLLDAGRNAEAVELLESLHRQTPDDKNVTIGLASAYASVAGLQVYAFYDLFYEAMFSKPWADLAKGKSQSPGVPSVSVSPEQFKNKSPSEAMNLILQNFVRALAAMIQISNILEKIPTVSVDNRPYLEQALILLDSLDHIDKAPAVFRSLLRATYLKHILATDLSAGTTSQIVSYDKSGHCQFNSSRLARGFTSIGKITTKLMMDLSIGFPKDKSTFAQVESSIRNSTSGVGALFDTASSVQMHREIDQALDRIWGCGT